MREMVRAMDLRRSSLAKYVTCTPPLRGAGLLKNGS